jgi:hypothetical protein
MESNESIVMYVIAFDIRTASNQCFW